MNKVGFIVTHSVLLFI